MTSPFVSSYGGKINKQDQKTSRMIDDDILNEQSIKIQLLKDKYSALRNEYHEGKKKGQMEIIGLQKSISTLNKKNKQLREKINQVKKLSKSKELEEYASNVIEDVWKVLNDFRRELIQRHDGTQKDIDSTFIDSLITQTPTKEYDSTMINYGKSVETPSLELEMISTIGKDSPKGILKNDTMTPEKSPIKRDKVSPYKRRKRNDDDGPYRGKTPRKNFMSSPLVHEDSIASRRTPRRCNLYYKDSSSREVAKTREQFTFASDGEMSSSDSEEIINERGNRKKYRF